jgi:PII-like signaling protein
MQIPENALLLRIFIGESDKHEHHPLYEVIIKQAREARLAGATMLRGAMGFGKSSHIHTEKILQLSMDMPVVIEIVDSEEKINAFLPTLDGLLSEAGALVTLEKLKTLHYRAKQPTEPSVAEAIEES